MKKLAVLSLLAVAVLFAVLMFTGHAQAQRPGENRIVDVQIDTSGTDPVTAEANRKAQAAIMAFAIVFWLFALVLAAVSIVSLWVIFGKAGKPGWAAIVPIYNIIVVLEICGRPIWWVLLLMIPCVQTVVMVIVFIDLAKSFGKDVLFGIGLALLGIVFLPMLAFGSAQYRGPAAA